MPSFNQTILVGNVVADPELVYLPSGAPKTSLTMAVNNPRGKKEDVLFMPTVFFGKIADVVMKYCKKGSSILVCGRLNQYIGTNKVKYISLMASDIQLLGKANNVSIPAETPVVEKDVVEKDNEIPF